ncbi:MAG: argininosuccinate lyase [Candidatus Omnitrophota bacterium]
MSKLWGSRFSKKTHPLMEKFTSSIAYDVKLAKYDVLASIAHAQMLGKTRIIAAQESAKIVQGLKSILTQIEKKTFKVDRKAEDIHSNIQSLLLKKIGKTAEKLHTARSRNDQVATDVRMYAKDAIKQLSWHAKKLQQTLVSFAKRQSQVIIPGFTHLQHAQPVLLAHHLLAYVEMLERDIQRLSDAYKRCDVLPLGSAALCGTSLPINRFYVAKLLGFSQVSANSMDAVSDRDFVLEILSSVAILAMHLSRLTEDLINWASPEFALLELDDAFSTGSSLMPQKKNPDALELVRGYTGLAYGNLLSLLTTMKGLPLSYNRDMQLDKPALFSSLEQSAMCLEILSAVIDSAAINHNRAFMLSADEFLYATDIVEYLVKKGLAFSQAHEIVGEACALALNKKVSLSEIPLKTWKGLTAHFEQDIYALFTPECSVNRKSSFGGTSSKNVTQQLKYWEKKLKN